MILEILLFTLLGCGFGIFTGLVPGVHVNLISIMLIGFVYFINPIFLAVAIIAMAISHTIFNFIPSILLGAPSQDTALSVLPGHRLLLQGRGLEAIYLTVIGGVGVIFTTLLLFPLMLFLIPFLYQNIQHYIHWLLMGIAAVLIFSETGHKKFYALLVFFLSGFLGIIAFTSFILPSHFMLFPVFTGLFGMSNLLISLNRKTEIPRQIMWIPRIPGKTAITGVLKGFWSGAILGVLPGVGAAQATVLTQQITRRENNREFLISIGAINTIVALFSLISLYTISRARSGAAVAVQKIIAGFGFNELVLLVGVALFATGISTLLILKSMKKIVSTMQKIDYPKLTTWIILLLLILTIVFTGFMGIFILFVSTSIGLLAPLFGVKRSNAMGCLMVPLVLFYAGIII